jgi:hypothetical protein
MGWNDRLPDCDQALPSEEEREAYFAWEEYQHYCAALEGAATSAPPPAGLSSQTIDPAQLADLGKDIFALPDRTVTPSKEFVRGKDQD